MTFDALRNWMLGRPKDERQLFDLLSTGVWITDAALNTHYVNPSMAALLGRAHLLRHRRHTFRRLRDQAAVAHHVEPPHGREHHRPLGHHGHLVGH